MADIMSVMERFGINKDEVIAKGVRLFINNQDPDFVKFEKYDNGYKIVVSTNKENVDEAWQFWSNMVNPYLNDGDDE